MKNLFFIISIVILFITVGCKKSEYNTDSVLFYPNSFSPDGDGCNDCWGPAGEEILTDGYLMKIYNKEDKLLFETDDFFKLWNGKVNNETCPIDYYYFIVKYQTINGEKHKDSGMFQLIY